MFEVVSWVFVVNLMCAFTVVWLLAIEGSPITDRVVENELLHRLVAGWCFLTLLTLPAYAVYVGVEKVGG